MYVCVCNSVTESDIRQAAERDGVRSFEQLRMETGCSTTCGRCEAMAREVLAESLHRQRHFLHVVANSPAA